MPIVKMKRLQVLALEREHDALLRRLERVGCVEISEPDAPDIPDTLRRCDSETADCLARQRQVQTAIDVLRRAAPPKKAPLLAPRPAIGESEYLSENALDDGLALACQVNDLTAELQRLAAQTAQLRSEQLGYGIICDEFGVTRGIITLKDIFEALVGELPDPREEPDIVRRDDGSCLVDGQCPYYDFLAWFGLEEVFPNNAYNTVSGLILDQLAHIPATGEKLSWNGFTLEIVDMDGARIDKVLVTLEQPEQA